MLRVGQLWEVTFWRKIQYRTSLIEIQGQIHSHGRAHPANTLLSALLSDTESPARARNQGFFFNYYYYFAAGCKQRAKSTFNKETSAGGCDTLRSLCFLIATKSLPPSGRRKRKNSPTDKQGNTCHENSPQSNDLLHVNEGLVHTHPHTHTHSDE